MRQPINILVVHDGITENHSCALMLGDLMSKLDLLNRLHLTSITEPPPPLDIKRAGFTVAFRDNSSVDRWCRSSLATDVPGWAWRLKACYLLNPAHLLQGGEAELRKFAEEILADLEQLFGRSSARSQSAVAIPVAATAGTQPPN